MVKENMTNQKQKGEDWFYVQQSTSIRRNKQQQGTLLYAHFAQKILDIIHIEEVYETEINKNYHRVVIYKKNYSYSTT